MTDQPVPEPTTEKVESSTLGNDINIAGQNLPGACRRG